MAALDGSYLGATQTGTPWRREHPDHLNRRFIIWCLIKIIKMPTTD